MRQNNLRRHPPKHKGHRDAKQDQSLVPQQMRVRRPQPGGTAEREDDDGRPFEEDGVDG